MKNILIFLIVINLPLLSMRSFEEAEKSALGSTIITFDPYDILLQGIHNFQMKARDAKESLQDYNNAIRFENRKMLELASLTKVYPHLVNKADNLLDLSRYERKTLSNELQKLKTFIDEVKTLQFHPKH